MTRPTIKHLLLITAIAWFMFACSQQNKEVAPVTTVNKAKIITKLDQDMADFAQALAKSLKSTGVRTFIKQEAAKKFDNDYDILFGKAGDFSIENRSFRQHIENNLPAANERQSNATLINRILSQNPLLNIAVPVHLEDWQTARYLPKVAVLPEGYDDQKTTHIKAFDADGKAYWLDAQNEPTEPVIVVGWNERLKTEEKFNAYRQKRDIVPIDECDQFMERTKPYYTSVNNNRYYLILPCDNDGGSTGGGGGGTGGGGPAGGDPNPNCYRPVDKVEKLSGMHFTAAGLNYYEGWPAGAPEVDVRIFVGDIDHNFTKEKEIRFYDNLEPDKRKDIKDKWWNPGYKSLFMWDEEKVGSMFLVHFVEDDQQIKILNREVTIPIKFIPFVNVSVTIKIDSKDEEIGYMIVDQCVAPPDSRDGRESYNINQYFAFSLNR